MVYFRKNVTKYLMVNLKLLNCIYLCAKLWLSCINTAVLGVCCVLVVGVNGEDGLMSWISLNRWWGSGFWFGVLVRG